MAEKMSIEELVAFGKAVSNFFANMKALIVKYQITQELLDAFEEYVQHMDAVGWIYDPTGYRVALNKGLFEMVKQRQQLVQELLNIELTIPELHKAVAMMATEEDK